MRRHIIAGRPYPPFDMDHKLRIDRALENLPPLEYVCLLLSFRFRFPLCDIAKLLDRAPRIIDSRISSARRFIPASHKSLVDYLRSPYLKLRSTPTVDKEFPNYLLVIFYSIHLCISHDIVEQAPIQLARLLTLLRREGPTLNAARYAETISAPDGRSNFFVVDGIMRENDLYSIIQLGINFPWVWKNSDLLSIVLSRAASLRANYPARVQLLAPDPQAEDLVRQTVDTLSLDYDDQPVTFTLIALIAEKFVRGNKFSEKLWEMQRSDGERLFKALIRFHEVYYDLGAFSKERTLLFPKIIAIRRQHIHEVRYPGMPMYQELVEKFIDWMERASKWLSSDFRTRSPMQ